jgi:MATE family multidrug resistance protein
MALLFGVAFMSCAAIALVSIPKLIARVYTSDPAVIGAGATLLMIAAIFQLFDALQVVAAGALRGAGNTHTAMLAHLLGYWVVGMPLAVLLCFKFGWGAVGFWTGFCVALISIGCILLASWQRAINLLTRLPLPVTAGS